MSGLILKIPGVTIPSGAALRTLNRRYRGFPLSGLQNLYLFEDGSGTTAASSAGDELPGALSGAGTATWLGGGGGVQLTGVKYLNAPTIDFTLPWTLAVCGRVDVATPGAVAPAEGIVGILGFSNFGVAPLRGAALYARRNPTPWSTSTGLSLRYRPTVNGAASSTETTLLADSTLTPDDGRLFLLSFDGTTTMTGKLVSAAGAVLTSATRTIDPVTATTASSVQVKDLPPAVGAFSGTYGSGSASVEAFAVYNKELSDEEIASLASAGATLGLARGRAW